MKLAEVSRKLFNPAFYFIIIALFLAEAGSYFGYIFFDIDHLFFIIIFFLTLFLSLRNIKYGVWLIILELFIGSQGYLFHLDIGTVKISLRIGLWLAVMSVWCKDFVFSIFKKKYPHYSIFLNKNILKTAAFPYFIILLFFIALGITEGFVHRNDFQNIFFDANSWFYFLLLFPFYETFFNPAVAGENPFRPVWRILAAATTWLCFKTYFLLFLFTHDFSSWGALCSFFYGEIYPWIRDIRMGEVTLAPGGFIRIFIQSQIFILITFILGLFIASRFWEEIKASRKNILLFIAAGAILSGAILVSFSRSFWVGAIVAFLFYAFCTLKKYGWKNLLSVSLVLLVSVILGLGIIFAVVKFPFPPRSANFDITRALTERAGKTNEAAISSRYALLPELWNKIQNDPVLGDGFGTTITYKTSDPRILEQNPSGIYTTYAFEWGWLDIWLKLGFFGFVFYLFLFGKIIKKGWHENNWLACGLAAGLILTIAVSIFSPYTNHPLGIGFLLLAAAAIFSQKSNSCACA